MPLLSLLFLSSLQTIGESIDLYREFGRALDLLTCFQKFGIKLRQIRRSSHYNSMNSDCHLKLLPILRFLRTFLPFLKVAAPPVLQQLLLSTISLLKLLGRLSLLNSAAIPTATSMSQQFRQTSELSDYPLINVIFQHPKVFNLPFALSTSISMTVIRSIFTVPFRALLGPHGNTITSATALQLSKGDYYVSGLRVGRLFITGKF
jgi:hypothetical protein